MKRSPLSLLFLASLFPSLLYAEKEYTVEKTDFISTIKFEAQVYPTEVTPLSLFSEEWSDFTITTLLPHGTEVSTGDLIASFDDEKIKKETTQLQHELELHAEKLSQLKVELSSLEEKTPLLLAEFEEKYNQGQTDYRYFLDYELSVKKENAKRLLEFSEWRLKNAQEELEQLLKMYEEDDLTEETEEIILERQRYAVRSAEWNFKQAEEEYARSLSTNIPREKTDRGRTNELEKLSYDFQKRTIQNALTQKQLALKKLEFEISEKTKQLESLNRDLQLFTLKSPANGVLFYGKVKNGEWNTSSEKLLVTGGKFPLKKTALTIIKTDQLCLHANLKSEQASQLNSNLKGVFSSVGAPYSLHQTTITSVEKLPGAKKLHSVTLELNTEKKWTVFDPVNCEIILAEKPEIISVPVKAVTQQVDKFFVTLKEGKKKQEVKVGLSNKEQIEITTGLEAGQVILLK